MRLLVTGAAGMLGRDVVRSARAAEHEVVALARADLDVTDAEAVSRAVASARPEAVINCAAWTDVDGAEADEAGAAAVNGAGAGNVARAAASAEAPVLHVSTDFVFDGAKDAPYVESDPTGPLSAYGRTKLEGERAVAEAAPRHAIVRTSWLFGTGGRNFVATMLELASERDEVRVVTDQIGCPTWTGHLAPVLVALTAGGAEGTFHVAGAGAASWNALATAAIRQAGADCRVEPATTEDFPRPARRPAYSVLGTERRDAPRLPPWQEGLAAYLAERMHDYGRPEAARHGQSAGLEAPRR
jgi:dTDP-4-dehydrorhamnose reductase